MLADSQASWSFRLGRVKGSPVINWGGGGGGGVPDDGGLADYSNPRCWVCWDPLAQPD